MFEKYDIVSPKDFTTLSIYSNRGNFNPYAHIKNAIFLGYNPFSRSGEIRILDDVNLGYIGYLYSLSPHDIDEYFQLNHHNDIAENNRCTCSSCGAHIQKVMSIKNKEGRYVCLQCAKLGSKGYDNSSVYHLPTATRKTYGFEFESVPYSREDYMSMLNSSFHLKHTGDSTLCQSGIEFKTPTYHGLNGLRKLFCSFDKHVDFSDETCGQHINIGDTQYINQDNIRILRAHTKPMEILYKYLLSHRTRTIKVCGRFFTFWADQKYYEDGGIIDRSKPNYSRHSSWINLEHDNRVEFRLSKFVTPDQYFALTCMWTEILDCMIHDIVLSSDDYDEKADKIIGKKMINIFEKYANGKAACQRRRK